MINTQPLSLPVKDQAGLTLIGVLLLIVITLFLARFLIGVAPIYIENFSITSSLKSLKQENRSGGISNKQLLDVLNKRLSINDVRNVKPEDISIENGRDKTIVRIHYQARAGFIGNIDLLVNFNDFVEINP